MVSNTLGMTIEDLVALLHRMALEYSNDSEYQEFRSRLPQEFPL
jgi:hypothetical protein